MRNQSCSDDEEHPRKSHGGETDPTEEAFGHLGVHGGQSHTGQGDRDQAFGVSPKAVLLQDIQEAVDKPNAGGHKDKEEDEANSANTFLQTAAEEHQGEDVQ